MADQTLSACMAEIKAHPGKFYVYVLSDPDGLPFYVGCGRGGRITAHLKEAKSKAKSVKVSFIRAALNAGVEIGYGIDSWHSDWPSAQAREVELIALIGRADLGTGPLANLTEGGRGVVSSPTSREKQSASMRRRWADQSEATRLRAAMKANYSDERREMMRALSKSRSGKPLPQSVKDKVAVASRKMWDDPEYRERRHQSQHTPEYLEKQRQQARRRWADPAFRERIMRTRNKTP